MSVPPLDRPKVFRPKMPATWWLKHPKYFLFMLRELSSVFIAIFVVVLLVQIAQLPHGEDAYHAFVQKFRAPPGRNSRRRWPAPAAYLPSFRILCWLPPLMTWKPPRP